MNSQLWGAVYLFIFGILSFLLGINGLSMFPNINFLDRFYKNINKKHAIVLLIIIYILSIAFIVMTMIFRQENNNVIAKESFIISTITRIINNGYILASLIIGLGYATYKICNSINYQIENIIIDEIKNANEFYDKVIKIHINRKYNRINKIIQTYINNNTMTDYKDFVSYSIDGIDNNKLSIHQLNISIERIFAITKPTDIYFISKQIKSPLHAEFPLIFKIKIIECDALDGLCSLPYPNYTIIEYNDNSMIMAETFPQISSANLSTIENNNYIGYIFYDEEYINTRKNIIREKTMSTEANFELLENYKIKLYENNPLIYLWSIVYMINKVINDKFPREKIEVYLVGSFAKLYNDYYENIINNNMVNNYKKQFNDIDIVINIRDGLYAIDSQLFESVIGLISDIISIYEIKSRLKLQMFNDHTPLVHDDYYNSTSSHEDIITYHVMITTPAVYSDVSKLVKYHRSKHQYSYNRKSSLENVSEYTLHDVLELPLGIKDMLYMLGNHSIRRALWNKEGSIYSYHSLTRNSPLAKSKNELYTHVNSPTEKCRLYKYIIKWSAINIAYASDISHKGFTLKSQYRTIYTYNTDFIAYIIDKIVKLSKGTLSNDDYTLIIDFYKHDCNESIKNIGNDSIRQTIIQYLQAIIHIINE